MEAVSGISGHILMNPPVICILGFGEDERGEDLGDV